MRPVRTRCTRGSSPRMRGKRDVIMIVGRIRRIIPAHAGQTSRSSGPVRRSSDHPRACGANDIRVPVDDRTVGSSPRMRGKPGHRVQAAGLRRIIPAHAGQTFCRSATVVLSADHPRACGANSLRILLIKSAFGSSPRMRGKPETAETYSGDVRIIPAHAGQTL